VTAAEGGATVAVTYLGRMPYRRAWELQHSLVAERKEGLGKDRLLLLEHDPVITVGRRGEESHVLASAEALSGSGVEVLHVERGGDVTYHGPGQLVAYPILDLHGFRRDVRWFATSLLEVVVRTVGRFGICAAGRQGLETGVWVDAGRGPAKLAALGVKIERWVTYHGVALNVEPDLSHFGWIVPCGLKGVRVTSMVQLLGHPLSPEAVRAAFVDCFAQVYGVRTTNEPSEELAAPGLGPDRAGGER
jgi:lipoate-protein ligase B